MTWCERENIFSKEVLTIEDIKLLYDIKSRSAAGEFLRSIKRKLRIDGIELLIDLPGKIHRTDYLSWVGSDDSQYGRKENARKYIAEAFNFPFQPETKAYVYNPLVGENL